MSERPEHLQCVKHSHAGLTGTWCGRPDGFFVSIDHAAYNARQGGRLDVCVQCFDAIVDALSGLSA